MEDPSIAGLPEPLSSYKEDDLRPALEHIIGLMQASSVGYEPFPAHLLEENAPILAIVEHIKKATGNPKDFYTDLEQQIKNFNAALPAMPESFGNTAQYKPKRSKKSRFKKKRSRKSRKKKYRKKSKRKSKKR